MKHIMFKAAGVFSALFLAFQLTSTDKTNAQAQNVSSSELLPIETAHHGGGCGCSTCTPLNNTDLESCS